MATIPAERYTRVSAGEAKRLRDMYETGGDGGRGLSLNDIRDVTGRSTGAISRAVSAAGGQLRRPGRREGSKNRAKG